MAAPSINTLPQFTRPETQKMRALGFGLKILGRTLIDCTALNPTYG
jgi:hypothetical protein